MLEGLIDTRVGGVLLSPVVRRRCRARGGRSRARPRGRRREEAELAVSARPTVSGLAEAQAEAPSGARDRGLSRAARAGAAAASARSFSACTTRPGSRTPATSGRGSPTRSSTGSRRCSQPLVRPDAPFAEVPRLPARSQRGGDVGGARRSSPRSSSPSGRRTAVSALPSTSVSATTSRRRRWSRRGSRCRPRSSAARALLKLSNLDKPFWPDEGITQGRPARLLPRHRARPRAAPPQPAVHDEALPGRLAGQALLPEGRAVAHAGLDPPRPVPRLDP